MFLQHVHTTIGSLPRFPPIATNSMLYGTWSRKPLAYRESYNCSAKCSPLIRDEISVNLAF